jgi:hypothetical protein
MVNPENPRDIPFSPFAGSSRLFPASPLTWPGADGITMDDVLLATSEEDPCWEQAEISRTAACSETFFATPPRTTFWHF